MAKATKCYVICNNRWGYTCGRKECNSIAEAKRYAQGMGFAYYIFDADKKRVIKSGYC